MARGVLGILMLLTYGIWDFVFERKLTRAERYITVCVKILSSMLYPITRHNSPLMPMLVVFTEGWGFCQMFLLSR